MKTIEKKKNELVEIHSFYGTSRESAIHAKRRFLANLTFKGGKLKKVKIKKTYDNMSHLSFSDFFNVGGHKDALTLWYSGWGDHVYYGSKKSLNRRKNKKRHKIISGRREAKKIYNSYWR